MIERKVFFDEVRTTIFGGSLSQGQVASMDATLDMWALYTLKQGAAGLLLDGLPDIRWLAYVFATQLGEVGKNMEPVRESFARFDKDARANLSATYADEDSETGESYYGRGLTQITHRSNFQALSDVFGIDLVAAPDIALGLHAAVLFQLYGMIRGTFTGQALVDHINEQKCDYYNARTIINGHDRASEIAGYAEKFEDALHEASDT